MDLITSHISQVGLNSSSEVRGNFAGLGRSTVGVDIEGKEGQVFIELDGGGVDESGGFKLNTDGSYTGNRTDNCMYNVLFRQTLIARA